MKIISGLYKGRKIEGFDIEGTRPTMERVKESLFAMLQEELPESSVLDLFSGSGNLGIEALSQGAATSYLVDKNKKAIEVMKHNIKELKIENAYPVHSDYQKALASFQEKNLKFDIIFLDPPYQTTDIKTSIELITKYNLLTQTGRIICESSDRDKIQYPSVYQVDKEKKYGDKWVVILRHL